MGSILLMAAAMLGALGILYLAARRAVTIAELDVKEGRVHVSRGAIAPGVLADVRDVARRPPRIVDARIVILRSRGHAEVRVSGDLPDGKAQQLRNVIGRVPLAKLLNARARR